jgi:DMSO/TMAO reductase YedYZ molybdopterin-dependent catalytic subunit
VWFEAADAAPFGKAPPFLRSIPLEKAKRDVLLAYDMNGVALPRRHGAPLRAIVPGWYGAASTKWLTRLRVEETPSDNHFMAKGYRWVYPGDDPATAPSVEAMRVKSLITTPREGSAPPAGALTIAGYAWSGEAAVARVEASTDGGKSWSDARLVEKPEAGTWVRWELKTTLAPGVTLEIAARATDTAGETQPEAARVNAPGYGNNSIHRVKVHAHA